MWKPTVERNLFENYVVKSIRQINTESDEPELKTIGEKFLDDNALILHSHLSKARWNQITDIIQRLYNPLTVQLDNGTWMN